MKVYIKKATPTMHKGDEYYPWYKDLVGTYVDVKIKEYSEELKKYSRVIPYDPEYKYETTEEETKKHPEIFYDGAVGCLKECDVSERPSKIRRLLYEI